MSPSPVSSDPTRLLSVAQAAGLAWFEVDADHRITAWSPGASQLTGFSAEESLGTPCVAAVRCHRCLAGCRVFEQGRADGSVALYHRNGTPLEVRKVGQALYDDDGQVSGAIEVLVAVEPVESQQPRPLRDVEPMASALGRIWVAADDHFRVLDASSMLSQITGWTEEELRGRPLAELLGGELWAEGSELRSHLLRGKRREGLYARLATAAGKQVPVSLSVASGDDGVYHLMIRRQADRLPEQRGYTEFESMVARSPAMLQIFRLIQILGDNDSTALICGESGTGKELVARALHNRSSRSQGPFVAVNCGALPNELLESELFGHVRGAFTGAYRDRQGRFEIADGGTLFLDEIGDLPKPLQVKLLRVLEDRTFQRVGESRTRTADVRVVAATNIELRDAVADKSFREDLYYRLRVLPIQVPPLRERKEDLAALTRHLLLRVGQHTGRAVELSPSAMRQLLAHDWPGNVRELENTLEYATAVCEGQTIHERDLPPELRRRVANGNSWADTPSPVLMPAMVPPADEDPEKIRLRAALEQAHYKRAETARILGVSRTTLWRKLKQHGLA